MHHGGTPEGEVFLPRKQEANRTLPRARGPKRAPYAATQGTKRNAVVVIGSPGDVPRALQHPAVANGELSVVAAVALQVGDEGSQSTSDLSEVLRNDSTRTILVAGPIGHAAMRQVADLARLYHCDLLAVMPTETMMEQKPAIVWNGAYPLVQLSAGTQRRWSNILKRAFDVIVAAVGIVLCAPLLGVLALAVRLESPGSALFRHERIGHRGRRFMCLKLRTMRADAEAELYSDPALYEEYRRHHFKIPEDRDRRVTRLGRLLRKTSLDELPQLWNVLVGEMSLVGPRPMVEDELGMYGSESDVVLSVRPGITGAWAVSGRQSVGYPERCALELDYVRGRSLGKDAKILMRTAAVVIGGLGGTESTRSPTRNLG